MKWGKTGDYHDAKGRKRRPFWILFFLVLLAVGGLLGGRMILRKNANYIGQNLIESYALDEERNIGKYENVVELAMSYINDMTDEKASGRETNEWVSDYFKKMTDIMDDEVMDSYAIVKGTVIASKEWEGMEAYDYLSKDWYKSAMKADGKVIFTNSYIDTVYGQPVVTIAAANPDTGNAVAFDLYPENFQYNHEGMQIPEDSSYYICDAGGTVLYHNMSFETSGEDVTAYGNGLYRKITSGELGDSGSQAVDLDGERRGIYYYHAPNGWLCILTIPHAALYENLNDIYLWYILLFIIVIIFVILIMLHDNKMRKRIRRADETVQALGNLYYAVYSINLKNSTYEMIKGSEYVRQRLPYKGAYKNLLEVLVGCMDEETSKDFARSFSVENISSLPEKEVGDFGGDFHRRFDEEYKWVNVVLVQDPQLIPGEVLMCFRIVEEEKQRQLEHVRLMEDALAKADASEKSQKQFFANMSHDMRTPLNAIIGMSDLAMHDGCKPEKIQNYLRKISVSSKQLLALINELLEMSRLENGKLELDNSSFNVCDVLKECVSPFKVSAKEGNKEIEVKIDVASPVVCGDSLRLTQILNNLLSNAVKFTKPGDHITVSLRQIENRKMMRYLFEVEDTGIGISKEFLPYLFEPYKREERFGSKKVSRRGLGLSIVKNFVSQMGGEITVDSTVGKGTRFSVALPFSVSTKEVKVEKEKEPEEFNALAGSHILLAEDNPLNMEIVVELLKAQNVEIATAENGREALERFAESKPFFFDAILMDIQMPEMDGCESARAIRALDRADAEFVPIIALTANTFPEDIARTVSARMNAHLSKPVEPELLFATLEQMITDWTEGRKTG
ncbi:MAG: ATP-binding protein [Roseburia sp.]|nr:ATP-binding protein [Roseburia sp.]